MITFSSKGDWHDTTRWLQRHKDLDFINMLEEYARQGVKALAAATPVDTGKTASSWEYSITKSKNGFSIYWHNTNVNNGVPIVILIQYGHVSKNGTYVPGYDFINPTIQPIFDEITNRISEEVRK